MKLLTLLLVLFQQSGQNFLLMEPIEDSILRGRMEQMALVCREQISVNLDEPFSLKGYLPRELFRKEMAFKYRDLQTEDLEWVSLQVDGNLAVQSINIILKDQVSGRRIPYKMIFFLLTGPSAKREWKIYYLRGLRI